MRPIASMLLVLLFSCQSFAQLSLKVEKATGFTDLKNPRLVNGIIIADPGSTPVFRDIAIVKAISDEDEKFISVWAWRAYLKDQQVLVEQVELKKSGDKEWTFYGDGSWQVEGNVYSQELGLRRAVAQSITLGTITPPKPDPPKPDPPKPDPDPAPSPIQNIFNVGKISYESRPIDQATATTLAKSYKLHAGKLYGNPALADIQTILVAIDKDFAAKQCPTQDICAQWATWKSKVQAAIVAEQKKRGTFNRNEWFECLMEIAYSLEAAK